ncbi:IS1595 family transposase [Hymenobacter lucidus]|nr:IS1595 family transposase [Hymenobacter lucidus]
MLPHFKSLLDLVKAFPTDEACLLHLEALRWNGTPVSPFDPTSRVYKCAGHRYKCKNTGKYFNVKVGTIFEDTKIPLQKWFMALYIFSSHKKGISSHQLARDIDVTQKSAWFLLHRLRYAFEHPNFKATLSGTVEVDETYYGGVEGNKHESRKTPGTQGRSTKTKKPIMGAIERNGNIVAAVVEDTKTGIVQSFVESTVAEGTVVMTDEYASYRGVAKVYEHQIVRHSAKQYVDGLAHTNSIECFWSHFKRGIEGIYHWVSFEHLQAYVNEFTLRYNTRRFHTADRFNLILGNIAGRLTYNTLISHE